MILLARRFTALVVVLLALGGQPARAMTLEERQALDLSAYRVTDRAAGYFDRAARRAYLATTTDPILREEIKRVRPGVPCADAMEMEPFAGDAALADFYKDNPTWKMQVAQFHRFEDALSALAAAQFVAPTRMASGRCVIEALDRWARGRAFLAYDRKKAGLQTWFQIESTLFAMAFAYSLVREDVPGMEAQKARIEAWLVAAARTHMAYPGAREGTCCNNHFYRRAVYAAMIGVLTRDDELFRYGVSAVYSAVDDAAPDGTLALEMRRGSHAAHYQNYAAMYLAFIAQIAARQGYDLYAVTKDGRSLDTILGHTLAINATPSLVAARAGDAGQSDSYLGDDQYLSWLELAAKRPPLREAALPTLQKMRPLYNRSLGGYATLYFMEP
ncbi:alginate lyase family protein [Altererythrobacter sp. CC-YST694]|uniref:alginate lyase family protein n=1 Tax=Altererythrobacter sp. CC-YST694 TaxID=2755038 RepID=UPI001D020F9D|nr:alginate lyase family protein [Altererythrobacter sp. CC-YST694]MCB5425159.1 alginate lyase family protein [Altererythrobacter sp. CC-YST694]